jgi:hypothetical protein
MRGARQVQQPKMRQQLAKLTISLDSVRPARARARTRTRARTHTYKHTRLCALRARTHRRLVADCNRVAGCNCAKPPGPLESWMQHAPRVFRVTNVPVPSSRGCGRVRGTPRAVRPLQSHSRQQPHSARQPLRPARTTSTTSTSARKPGQPERYCQRTAEPQRHAAVLPKPPPRPSSEKAARRA